MFGSSGGSTVVGSLAWSRAEDGQNSGNNSASGTILVSWSGTSCGKHSQRDYADWRPHSDRLTALSFALLIWTQTLVNGHCLMLPILGIFVHRSGGRSSVRGTIVYRPGKQNSDRRDGGQGPPRVDATAMIRRRANDGEFLLLGDTKFQGGGSRSQSWEPA